MLVTIGKSDPRCVTPAGMTLKSIQLVLLIPIINASMTQQAAKPNPLLEIAVTIVAPSIVLMQFSGNEKLGPLNALLLALAFPFAWGIYDGWRRRKVNWLAVLGVVSTLLTGGIGLLELDAKWLAIKEAAVPLLIGIVVLGSTWTRTPLIHLLVFNETLFDVARVNEGLASKGTRAPFEQMLRTATAMLAGTFFFSAVVNYFLSRWVVSSPAGTEAFNQELGRLTLLSYPFIAVPTTLMTIGLFFWLARNARALTGLDIGEMLNGSESPASPQ